MNKIGEEIKFDMLEQFTFNITFDDLGMIKHFDSENPHSSISRRFVVFQDLCFGMIKTHVDEDCRPFTETLPSVDFFSGTACIHIPIQFRRSIMIVLMRMGLCFSDVANWYPVAFGGNCEGGRSFIIGFEHDPEWSKLKVPISPIKTSNPFDVKLAHHHDIVHSITPLGFYSPRMIDNLMTNLFQTFDVFRFASQFLGFYGKRSDDFGISGFRTIFNFTEGSQSKVYLLERTKISSECALKSFPTYPDRIVLKCVKISNDHCPYLKCFFKSLAVDAFMQMRGPLVGTPLANKIYDIVRTPFLWSVEHDPSSKSSKSPKIFGFLTDPLDISLKQAIRTPALYDLVARNFSHILFRIIASVALLAEANIAHGDIKEDNIMLKFLYDEEVEIEKQSIIGLDSYLIDFGLATTTHQHFIRGFPDIQTPNRRADFRKVPPTARDVMAIILMIMHMVFIPATVLYKNGELPDFAKKTLKSKTEISQIIENAYLTNFRRLGHFLPISCANDLQNTHQRKKYFQLNEMVFTDHLIGGGREHEKSIIQVASEQQNLELFDEFARYLPVCQTPVYSGISEYLDACTLTDFGNYLLIHGKLEDVKSLIKFGFVLDFRKRPTAKELLKHYIFATMNINTPSFNFDEAMIKAQSFSNFYDIDPILQESIIQTSGSDITMLTAYRKLPHFNKSNYHFSFHSVRPQPPQHMSDEDSCGSLPSAFSLSSGEKYSRSSSSSVDLFLTSSKSSLM